MEGIPGGQDLKHLIGILAAWKERPIISLKWRASGVASPPMLLRELGWT